MCVCVCDELIQINNKNKLIRISPNKLNQKFIYLLFNFDYICQYLEPNVVVNCKKEIYSDE